MSLATLPTAAWARDKRDSVIYTTAGTLQRLSTEVSVPLGDLTYYRLTYRLQWYYPLSRTFTSLLQTRLGYGDGYDNQDLPFYKNFFAGGVNTVRGYAAASLGPQDTDGNALGGELQVINNFELLFPFPGLGKDRSIRLATFIDMGMVGNTYEYLAEEMRYSAGLSINWFSPVGPLKLIFAYPINDQPGDQTEQFQFTFGSAF